MKTTIIIIFIVYFVIKLISGIYTYFFISVDKAKRNIVALTTTLNKKNYLVGIVENTILIVLLSLLFIL